MLTYGTQRRREVKEKKEKAKKVTVTRLKNKVSRQE